MSKKESKWAQYDGVIKRHIDDCLGYNQSQIVKCVLEEVYPVEGYSKKKFSSLMSYIRRNHMNQDNKKEETVNYTVSAIPDYKTHDTLDPSMPSAWDEYNNIYYSFEDYCSKFNLPVDDVSSYKLVAHNAGHMIYNIVFKRNALEESVIKEDLNEDFIEKVIKKHIKPCVNSGGVQGMYCDDEQDVWFDRCVYTDVHVGMCTDFDGSAMYSTRWDSDALIDRCDTMISEILDNQRGTTLYLDDLGDFMDGWDGQTTRGGHKLPQNMSNQEAFDYGLQFKMRLVDNLVDNYTQIYVNNICNDNHSGDFGYIVNSAFKNIVEAKYPQSVGVSNATKFINHYFVGDNAFVISHGKDDKTLKFGFKPKIDDKQIIKIDQYLKHYNVSSSAKTVEFGKGDSHQMLFDWSSSDDFHYFNFPAFSPSSQWVQNNFKKGSSGFVMFNIKYDGSKKVEIPYFFK